MTTVLLLQGTKLKEIPKEMVVHVRLERPCAQLQLKALEMKGYLGKSSLVLQCLSKKEIVYMVVGFDAYLTIWVGKEAGALCMRL